MSMLKNPDGFITDIILRREVHLFGGFFFYAKKTLMPVTVAVLHDLIASGRDKIAVFRKGAGSRVFKQDFA
ncbi:MAG: hypothetical protein K6D93_03720 [Saccharofermentans sp.]|nr:hypothetical protein [Saccharofermentans sp.]